MPRPRFSKVPAILRTQNPKRQRDVTKQSPRLWNAKRRIESNRGLTNVQYAAYQADPRSEKYKSEVSHDVAEFIEAFETEKAAPQFEAVALLPEQKGALLRNPAQYFSRPHNVPEVLRKQVHFPKFSITLLRTPHLSPYYAVFQVPLRFNKLDMKSYLKELYDVDVVHIRSYTRQPKLERKESPRPNTVGGLYRPKSQKRMTAQLVDPFVWPKEIEDLTQYDKEEYWRATKAQYDINKRSSDGKFGQITTHDQQHRRTIALQARDVLQGKQRFTPTWQQFDADKKVLAGIADILPKMPPETAARTRLGRRIA